MSFGHPKCKAFCRRAEQAFWVAIAFALLVLWGFYIWKAVTS